MTASSSQLSGLTILGKLILEGFGYKGSSIVRLILLYNDAIVPGNRFKSVDSFKSFIGVQVSLKFNMCKASAGIHKDAAAFAGIDIVASVV